MSALYITLARHGIRHQGKSNRDRLIAGHHLLHGAARDSPPPQAVQVSATHSRKRIMPAKDGAVGAQS